jgi:hypothetical protein
MASYEQGRVSDNSPGPFKPGARDQILTTLVSLGYSEPHDTLFSGLEEHLAYLERCFAEARAVLQGDQAAATRLWLLLREPLVEDFPIPQSVLDQLARNSPHDFPIAVDGDYLITLLAGTVRAANQPADMDVMIESLARLLDPLLLIVSDTSECRAAAIRRRLRSDGSATSRARAAVTNRLPVRNRVR